MISLAELYEGAVGARDPVQSERELNLSSSDGLTCWASIPQIARIFGVERKRLRDAGRMIGDMDLLIAATAIRHDLTLLTNNRRHFERIPSLAVESI